MVKVAVVQAGSALFDTPATMKKLERFAREAAADGAKLILFPGGFVGGYPRGAGFAPPRRPLSLPPLFRFSDFRPRRGSGGDRRSGRSTRRPHRDRRDR